MHSFQVRTSSRTEFVDITAQVSQVVREQNFKDGTVIVYIPHTTAGVTINENADPDVKRDIIYAVNKTIPFEDNYQHAEGNSAAHIKASFFGSSAQIIAEQGRLLLGTWQGIFFCEFDGPRNRNVWVKLIA